MQEITEEMVFQKAMTSDYSKIDTLPLLGLNITSVAIGVGLLRRMNKLVELNLSNNKIGQVGALSELRGLQTLILMNN